VSIPHCPRHLQQPMELLPADRPAWHGWAGIGTHKYHKTTRMIYRCPQPGCPCVASAEQQSQISEYDRRKRAGLCKERYTEEL
jgi:hypothetical protein